MNLALLAAALADTGTSCDEDSRSDAVYLGNGVCKVAACCTMPWSCRPFHMAEREAEIQSWHLAMDCAEGSDVAHLASETTTWGYRLMWYDADGAMIGYRRYEEGSPFCCEGSRARTFMCGNHFESCYDPTPTDAVRSGEPEQCEPESPTAEPPASSACDTSGVLGATTAALLGLAMLRRKR